MSDEERTWRDAKIPQWVKDSILAEQHQWELTAALSWPTEAKPEPLSFRWGEYDNLRGEPQEGVFYAPFVGGTRVSLETVHIKRNDGAHGQKWKHWAFSSDGENWHTTVTRGPLFDNERDARTWMLWNLCEDCAKRLLAARRAI